MARLKISPLFVLRRERECYFIARTIYCVTILRSFLLFSLRRTHYARYVDRDIFLPTRCSILDRMKARQILMYHSSVYRLMHRRENRDVTRRPKACY